MHLHRRQLLLAGLSLPVAAALPGTVRAAGEAGAGFGPDTVPALAAALAAAPWRAPSRELPDELSGLGYDRYRDYRYRPGRALWAGQGRGFEAQFFHRGYMFLDRVDMHVVEGGRSRLFAYSPSLFRFDHGVPVPEEGGDLGFAVELCRRLQRAMECIDEQRGRRSSCQSLVRVDDVERLQLGIREHARLSDRTVLDDRELVALKSLEAQPRVADLELSECLLRRHGNRR